MNDSREILRRAIIERVFVSGEKRPVIGKMGGHESWMFDFRRILLEKNVLSAIAKIFYSGVRGHGAERFQVGGMESAAIPLISSIVMNTPEKFIISGFYIRKSRKRDGLLNMVEGNLGDDPVILVDDILNSGASFIKQIEILESLGKKVLAVFAILRFRKIEFYEELHRRGITILSVFSLDDLAKELPVALLTDKEERPKTQFVARWRYVGGHPNFRYVVPKSAPAIDEKHVYFGCDDGAFVALDKEAGKVSWTFRTKFGSHDKFIFSSPALAGKMVIFGTYDGNVYALDRNSGKELWRYTDADWVGSSPAVATELGLVFIGLEFGLFGRHGGIAALDLKTGERRWGHSARAYTPNSPYYVQENKMVYCGDNDGIIRAYAAKNGKMIWSRRADGATKASFVFDKKRGQIAFGTLTGTLYILDSMTGDIVREFRADAGIFSTPALANDMILVTSLDKHLYALSSETGNMIWKRELGGRIFASPVVAGGKVYIGSNSGRLFELSVDDGSISGYFQATERIVNRIAFDEHSRDIYLPTQANEIYRLSAAE